LKRRRLSLAATLASAGAAGLGAAQLIGEVRLVHVLMLFCGGLGAGIGLGRELAERRLARAGARAVLAPETQPAPAAPTSGRPLRVHVVYAHPSHRSFTHAVLEAFLAGLREAGHEVDLHDLYADGWRSDMDAAQYARETGGDPDAPVPADVAREQARLNAADALVFVFPLWWSDVPAILKGWFDRVLTYGYAYRYEDDARVPPRLSVARGLVLCTAGHTVEHLEETGVAPALRAVVLQDRMRGVGVREARLEILGGMTTGGEEVRRLNLERARRIGREF